MKTIHHLLAVLAALFRLLLPGGIAPRKRTQFYRVIPRPGTGRVKLYPTKFKAGVRLFANEAEGGETFTQAVELVNITDASGVKEVPKTIAIPFGNWPHRRGVQVFDRQAGEAMRNDFENERTKKGANFVGMPIYLGHPDVPEFANQWPDKRAKGWVRGAEVSETALTLAVDFNAAGRELVANEEVKFISPTWLAEPVSGRTAAYRPTKLKSIGLVNDPNIAVAPLTNEATGATLPGWLCESLGLPADATEEQAVAALNGHKEKGAKADEYSAAHANLQAKADEANKAQERLSKAHGQLSKAHSALTGKMANAADAPDLDALLALDLSNALADELRGQLTGERLSHATVLVNQAITAGRLTLANKDAAIADLTSTFEEFPAKVIALANRAPVLRVGGAAHTENLGKRKEAGDRSAKVLELVNERMAKTGEEYPDAFANIRKTHSALFAEMQQPAKA